MGKCKFDPSWLSKKDSNGDDVGAWAEKSKSSQGKIFCRVCMATFAHHNGMQSISQHAGTDGHKKRMRLETQAGLRQLNLQVVEEVPAGARATASTAGEDPQEDPDEPDAVEVRPRQPTVSVQAVPVIARLDPVPQTKQTVLRLFDSKQSARTAELIWVLKCVDSNYSFASCDNIEPIFRRMFPGDNAVPAQFCLKSTKAAYLLTDALAPYCQERLLADIGDSLFTLLYDETLNNAGKKELEVAVRYWSKIQGKIHTQHLRSYYLGKATSDVVVEKLEDSMDSIGLKHKNLLSLGSDGPNVNKAVWRKLNQKIISERTQPLVDIGTCNIHILHTAYERGLDELGERASNFIVQVYDFFDGWPSRWEEYEAIQVKLQVPDHCFRKHVPSRWLSVEPAAERALEQMPALEEYFLKYLPQKNSDLAKKPAAMKIKAEIKDPFLKAELYFIMSSAQIFTKFTGFFQKDEPLVHLLYSELESLCKKLMGRVCKSTAIDKEGLSVSALTPAYLVKPENVEVGERTKTELNRLSDLAYPASDITVFRSRAQKHFVAALTHIFKKSALKSKKLVRALRCLHPDERTRNRSKASIAEVAKALPLTIDVDALRDEWTILMAEPASVFPSKTSDIPVDVYWQQIFNLKTPAGEPKYGNLTKVVKAALSLSHGNAFVEREFSVSNLFLSPVKSNMKERALNAAMTVKSGLRLFGGPSNFPVDDRLLTLARSAHRRYDDYLEAERLKSEAQKRLLEEEEIARQEAEKAKQKIESEQKKIEEEENKIQELRKTVKEKRELFDTLQTDAKKRLKKATESKNLKEVSASQAIFDAADNVRKEVEDHTKKLDSLQRTVEKRKSKMIETLAAKKSRPVT